MINLDDHLEDHLAEKAILEAKAKAEEEANDAFIALFYRAQSDNATFDRVRSEAKYKKAIVKALESQTELDVVYDETSGKISIGGVSTDYVITIEQERTSYSRFSSRPTGKTRIVVGDYGDRTSYPQRKDGGHNYEAIADKLVNYAERKIAQDRANFQARVNQSKVDEVIEATGHKNNYGNVRFSSSAARDLPVFVTVEIKKSMTSEQAIAVHAALKQLGLV